MSGIPAYAEDLFYRIKKEKLIDLGNGNAEWTTIQNILIPNTSDLDIVKYVDTQLKYGYSAIYRYTVYTERVVFGSKYYYRFYDQEMSSASGVPVGLNYSGGPARPFDTDLAGMQWAPPPPEQKQEWFKSLQMDPDPDNNRIDFHATLTVNVSPNIQIIEDKLFMTPEIFIMDKPPPPPDVNIVPYRAISNRVKMLITGNVDRYRAKPVIMLESDADEFDKALKAQLSIDGQVEFASDDPTGRYQIFKTDKRPKKYSDFELYKDISSSVFEERILPNTKYYYTFRSIDTHNHISNPTSVYEVELIDEQGAVKPIIRTISMEPEEKKNNIKEGQKYIYLKTVPKAVILLRGHGN